MLKEKEPPKTDKEPAKKDQGFLKVIHEEKPILKMNPAKRQVVPQEKVIDISTHVFRDIAKNKNSNKTET